MNQRPANVLLIDDDNIVHSVLRYHLERAGFVLLSATSSEEALRVLAQKPDLLAVLVDIHLPRPDVGWALLDRLNSLKTSVLAHTPIVVYSVDDDKNRAKLAGADEHIVKPIDYKEIITLIEKYAGQRSKA